MLTYCNQKSSVDLRLRDSDVSDEGDKTLTDEVFPNDEGGVEPREDDELT
jgi:hypothetical protein